MGRVPTPWLDREGGLKTLFTAIFWAEICVERPPRGKAALFLAQAKRLDARRLEEYLFGTNEQLSEQVNE